MRDRTLFTTWAAISAVFIAVPNRAATFTVANGDVAGFKSAVQTANLQPGPDTIVLANNGNYSFATYHATANPLNRTALPIITSAITIEGNGSVIRRADPIAMPIPIFRLIRVSANGVLVLRSATIRNGDASNVEDGSDSEGSGLRNDGGSLTIEDCRFDNNRNTHWAAGVFTKGPTIVTDSEFIQNTSGDGGTGAIRAIDTSSLIIERCQFTENRGDDTIKIYNVGNAEISRSSVVKTLPGLSFTVGISVYNSTLTVANCTITQGTHTGIGASQSSLTVTHCTITEHGVVNYAGRGIAFSNGSLKLRNSILAFNDNGPAGSNVDCMVGSGGVLLENIRNLIKDGSCNPDFIGNPKLGSLGYHGGTTKVYPLVEGSQAIDNGHDSYSEPTDQRGVARPIGAHSDIGAYEGSIPDERRWRRIMVDLIELTEPYIIICDPLPDEGPMVSVAGTRTVPARSIDAASLALGNAQPGSARVHGFSDVNRDGIEDMTVSFRWADVNAGAFSCAEVTLLEMQGWTSAGQPIVGYMNVVAR
jgi:hypothetical protein